jgi:hypothetical protein
MKTCSENKFKIGLSVIDAQYKQLFPCDNDPGEAFADGLKPSTIDQSS